VKGARTEGRDTIKEQEYRRGETRRTDLQKNIKESGKRSTSADRRMGYAQPPTKARKRAKKSNLSKQQERPDERFRRWHLPVEREKVRSGNRGHSRETLTFQRE